jgi:flagellar protein FliS
MNQGYSAYKTANVDTADKGKLIIICYDVAIKHGNLAIEIGNDSTRYEEQVKHLYKMQDAISELLSALNMSVGEISNNLYKMYEYMLHRITTSVVKKDMEPINEIMKYLDDLRGAWKVAIQNVKTSPQQSGKLVING